MRHTIATLVLLAAALPAAAADTACVTVSIDHYDDSLVAGSPYVAAVDWAEGAPRYALNGAFVWFDFGAEPSAGESDTLSFDVSDPDVVAAVACSDGSVSIELAEAEPAPPADEDPVEPTPTSLTPICEAHADTLTHYCTLGNRTLVIS